MRSWEDFKAILDMDENRNFYRIQVISTISSAWKEIFLECGNNTSNLIINEHHLIHYKELYNMLIILKVEKPIAETCFEKDFQNHEYQ